MAGIVQATAWMATGCRVRRSAWHNPTCAFFSNKNAAIYMGQVDGSYAEYERQAWFSLEDLQADDWDKVR
jgi:hypothetical protein